MYTGGRDAVLDGGKGYYQHPLVSKNDLTIASLNINGFRGHSRDSAILHSSSINVLALTEAKLDPHQGPSIQNVRTILPIF